LRTGNVLPAIGLVPVLPMKIEFLFPPPPWYGEFDSGFCDEPIPEGPPSGLFLFLLFDYPLFPFPSTRGASEVMAPYSWSWLDTIHPTLARAASL